MSQQRGNTDKRLEAFSVLSAEPCEGLDLGNFDRATYDAMVAAAAAAGDVRAQALRLAQKIEAPYRASGGRTRYELGEADFAQALALLSSGDPQVISDLQGVLSSTLQHGGVRLAGERVDPEALYGAFTLLACDAGAPCRPDSQQVLRACAYRDQCGAGSVYEYSYYYAHSPSESQLIDSYHAQLSAMLNARDFSGLAIVPTDVSNGYSMTFGTGGPD